MPDIHASAIVDPKARVADSVKVGPFCIIGPDVELGEDCVLMSHVVIEGRTRIGARNSFFPFASIGHAPQDLKYRGEESRLEIGDDNVIREYVTMHPGTEGGGMLTRIGNRCLFMIGVHVAHDCMVGDQVIMANNATLAGHVVVDDYAVIGGLSAVHQFVRIGQHAMIGGMSGVEQDVIPYGSVMGDRARLSGLNLVGMKRRGLAREAIHDLRAAYKDLFSGEGTLVDRLQDVEQKYGGSEPVRDVIGFIRAESSRAICQPARDERGGKGEE